MALTLTITYEVEVFGEMKTITCDVRSPTEAETALLDDPAYAPDVLRGHTRTLLVVGPPPNLPGPREWSAEDRDGWLQLVDEAAERLEVATA